MEKYIYRVSVFMDRVIIPKIRNLYPIFGYYIPVILNKPNGVFQVWKKGEKNTEMRPATLLNFLIKLR